MKEEGIDQPYKETDKGIWVTYKEVPNFYNSTSFSRHFVVDYATGKIMFGDGIHGINPPKGKFNIRADTSLLENQMNIKLGVVKKEILRHIKFNL